MIACDSWITSLHVYTPGSVDHSQPENGSPISNQLQKEWEDSYKMNRNGTEGIGFFCQRNPDSSNSDDEDTSTNTVGTYQQYRKQHITSPDISL